jgi:hypothetical protein
VIDYLDEDVAYLLGLIVSRGKLIDAAPLRSLVIEFPFKSLTVAGVTTVYDQSTQLVLGSNKIRDRISELLGTTVSVVSTKSKVMMNAHFLQNSIVWRNLKGLIGGAKDYTSSTVPTEIFQAPASLKREFIRGVADASAWLRPGTFFRDKSMGKRRVFLAVDNRNWQLPVQLCSLLQQHLGIPVGEILWGHPNLRDPGCRFPNRPEGREHQIRVFCEAFEQVGFNLDYKNQLLKEFAQDDRENRSLGLVQPCNPLAIRSHAPTAKASHPQEHHNRLPSAVRGKHFESYWEICLALGCQQGHFPTDEEPAPDSKV